ncbi:MAG: AbrB/MazE/SpoVT family DNA-binding domain-containing protein [Spirochaetia bacterium]|jgi:AbrB family looped-hinge helix DNA binding protein
MKAIVSEKGQVTIPKGVRDVLGIRKGTVLEFEALGGKLVAVKKGAADGFMRWRGKGKLPGDSGVDEYLRKARG